jgi:phospholipid-binding lipoprotein MlaA
MPPGPYVVLPLLGPSTLRDTAALTLDLQAAPTILLGVTQDRVGVTILGIVNARASLLDATGLLETISLDRYQFTRDAYLARRQSLVLDGKVPAGDEAFDYDDYQDDTEAPPAGAPASSPPAR